MAPRPCHEIAALQLRLPAEGDPGSARADRVAGVHALAPLSFEQSFPTLPVPPCPPPPSPSRCHLLGQSTPRPPRCTSSPSPTSRSPRCEDGPPIARSTACASPLSAISKPRTVIANYPNHVWGIDTTAVPTSAGFWTSWFPFSLAQFWPFCWWLAVVIDHWSRRSLGLAAFKRRPTADEICIVLDEAARRAGGVPKYTVSDQGSEFGEEYLEWCDDHDVRARFGAVGRHGSIAVEKRFIRTLKQEGLAHELVPLRHTAFCASLARFEDWYNEVRPHSAMGGATPDEVFHGRRPPTAAGALSRGRGTRPGARVRHHGRRRGPRLERDWTSWPRRSGVRGTWRRSRSDGATDWRSSDTVFAQGDVCLTSPKQRRIAYFRSLGPPKRRPDAFSASRSPLESRGQSSRLPLAIVDGLVHQARFSNAQKTASSRLWPGPPRSRRRWTQQSNRAATVTHLI